MPADGAAWRLSKSEGWRPDERSDLLPTPGGPFYPCFFKTIRAGAFAAAGFRPSIESSMHDAAAGGVTAESVCR